MLLISAAAYASETITYTYDALGRIVKVARSGSVNNGATSCYAYDPANNRSNLIVSASSDCSGVTFSVSDVSANEGTSLTFTVTKSGTASGTVTVDYATANGTATAGTDYTTKSGTLSFLTGDTTKTVSVTTTNDALVEGNETVLLNLSNATGGATISDAQGVGTIIDNDGTCNAISFTIASNGSVTEGVNSSFTVTKSGTTSNSCSVNYATANGTAVAPGDYTATSGTLTFTSAQGSKTVNVTTIDDAAIESAETFTMSLSAPTGGAIVAAPGTATATINDNDSTNHPPVANFDDAGNISCGGGVTTVNVLANDTDPEGNYPLSLVSANGGSGIFVSVVNSTDIRIIGGSQGGTYSFTYVVQDSLGAQSPGSGSVTLTTPCQ